MFKSYGRFHLIRVLPQLIALASAEYVIALASGHRDRAAAVAHAWRWNFVRRRAIRAERMAVRAHRLLDDGEVRRLQLHGSARLNAYIRRAVNQGLKAAHLGAESDVGEGEAARDSAHRRRLRADALSLRVVAWVVAVVVLVFGTRQLLGSGFPYVGQLLPLPSAGSLLHRFLSGWQPSGVGTTDPTSPATGILGVAGFVAVRRRRVAAEDRCPRLPPRRRPGHGSAWCGPWGRRVPGWRRPSSTWPFPCPMTRWRPDDGTHLLAYAACPWIVSFLARASRFAPFGPLEAADLTGGLVGPGQGRGGHGTSADCCPHRSTVASADACPRRDTADGRGAAVRWPDGAAPGDVHRRSDPGGERRCVGQMLGLGVLDACLTSAAPVGSLPRPRDRHRTGARVDRDRGTQRRCARRGGSSSPPSAPRRWRSSC